MKNKNILGICSAAAVLAAASSSYAVSDELRYSIDGGAWVTVVDNQSGDTQNTVDNVINVNINAGGWSGSVSVGRNLGTPGAQLLDLDLSLVNTGTGTIIVEYGDIGFTGLPSSYSLFGGGNLFGNGSANTYAFVGPNSIFGGTDPNPGDAPSSFPPSVSPGGVIGPITGLGGTSGTVGSQSDPYSLTIATVYSVTPNPRNFLSDDISLTAVPDGGNTLMMLGSALSVLGLGVFRRKAVKA